MHWSPATGISCSTCANPVVFPSVTTQYNVTVTDNIGNTVIDFVMCNVSSCSSSYCGNSGSFQCTPSGTLTQPGFQPVYDSLPPFVNGVASTTVIQFKNIDTVNFGGTVLTVQSLKYDSIEGLPSGLCWATDQIDNTYMNQEDGCIKINGTTCAPPGQYRLRIVITVNVGIPITTDARAAGIYYYLRVKNSGDADILVDTTGQSNFNSPAFQAYGGTADCASVCAGFQISNSGYSMVSCPGGADGSACVYISGGTPGYNYTWSPPAADSSCATNLSVGSYSVTITDVNNCTLSTNINVLPSPNQCVWPGDADFNGLADNNDLLPIGLAYGTIGTSRTDQSIGWYAHPSLDWPDTLSSGTNYKHIDCNGNGLINADDTLAILQNYSLTHAKTEDHIAGWRMTDPALNVVLTPDTTRAGDTMYANLTLGDLNIPASNIYGLAFTINYDALVVDSSKTKVTFGNSWLGNATDKISIAKDFPVDGQLKCALTRIDHTTRSGFGQIGQALFVVTTDNINGKNLAYHQMNVWISDLRVIDNLGNYISVNEGYDSSQVEFEPTNVGIDQNIQPKIGIVPNPANDMVHISVSDQLVGANVKVLDINGQLMTHVVLGATNTQLSVHDYPAGIYLLQFMNEGAVITKRLVVTH